jgi:hypothetical protein
VWTDAISVNQADKEELGYQVTLMKEIYRHCTGVLIWLGNESDDGADLILEPCRWLTNFESAIESPDDFDVNVDDQQKIDEYNGKFMRYYRRPKHLRHSLPQDYQLGSFCVLSLLAQNKCLNQLDIPVLLAHLSRHNILQAMGRMMDQDWWGRHWVIQETVLAPKALIHYGRFIIPWETLAVAARNYQVHRQDCCSSQYAQLPFEEVNHLAHFARTVLGMDNWRQSWLQKGQDPEIFLLQLLWQFRRRDTGRPKDKIFALLPLVTRWGLESVMFAHYEYSDSDIYRLVAETLIKVHDSLLVLMGTTEKSNRLRKDFKDSDYKGRDLPSWVPDWTVKPYAYELERLDRALLYNASKGDESPEERIIDDYFLHLGGAHFDVVTSLGAAMPDDYDGSLHCFHEWQELCGVTEDTAERYVGGGLKRDAFWRTICMDTVYVGKETDLDNLPLNREDYQRAPPKYTKDYDQWLDDGRDGAIDVHDPLQVAYTFGPRLPVHSSTAPLGTLPPNLSSAGAGAGAGRRARTDAARNSGVNNKNPIVPIDIAVTSATTHRRFFLTEQGYMGLGPRGREGLEDVEPKGMQEGDIVFVLSGGYTPFLLRSVGMRDIPGESTHECYELVGDCYVHGIMDGEAMKAKQEVYLV